MFKRVRRIRLPEQRDRKKISCIAIAVKEASATGHRTFMKAWFAQHVPLGAINEPSKRSEIDHSYGIEVLARHYLTL
jgi:hypothetical protein